MFKLINYYRLRWITIRRIGLLAETIMFPKQISVNFFASCVLIHAMIAMRSDCLQEIKGNENINFNLNIATAVNFIIQSVNATNVRAVGCKSFFHNDFNELSEHWRTNVSLTLLNVERKYSVVKKIPRNDLILMFVDQQFVGCWQKFMENTSDRFRKHKLVVVFKPDKCNNNGWVGNR